MFQSISKQQNWGGHRFLQKAMCQILGWLIPAFCSNQLRDDLNTLAIVGPSSCKLVRQVPPKYIIIVIACYCCHKPKGYITKSVQPTQLSDKGRPEDLRKIRAGQLGSPRKKHRGLNVKIIVSNYNRCLFQLASYNHL